MEIKLESPLQIKVIEPEIAEIDAVKICYFNDNPENKTVTVMLELMNSNKSITNKGITLWEGEGYDIIGDWTGQQAEDRIKELITQ